MVDSTCESAYISIGEASKEAIWIRNFMCDLRVVLSNKDPLEILGDNEGEIALNKEARDHEGSRHIKRKFHYIQDIVENEDLVVKRLSSEENPADLFIKGITKERHSMHAKSMCMRDDVKFSS